MEFVEYSPTHEKACLELFDLNCPGFFAPNEWDDYKAFLAESPVGYRVILLDQKVVAAFGFRIQQPKGRGLISWIMVSPECKGQGVGSEMMARVRQAAKENETPVVDIAASHLSAPFFSRFGATEIDTLPHGWGPGMHRVNMEWVV